MDPHEDSGLSYPDLGTESSLFGILGPMRLVAGGPEVASLERL
jgi:hypothetical protein